ncbi:hypothetical protein HK102_000560 [Quaeritorhiza haematococci]|nr:hypothetical protein HK102_000560 [Quaeritorhiza haematococci]
MLNAADTSKGEPDLDRTIEFVNRELAAQGFPAPFYRDEEGKVTVVLSNAVTCFFSILQQFQKERYFREDIHARFAKITDENSALSNSLARCKQQLEQTERELNVLKTHNESTEKTLRQTTHSLQITREELKVARVNLQNSKAQYFHEVKKRDLEHERLKDKLQKLSMPKQPAQKYGMTMKNSLGKPVASSRKPQNPTKTIDPLYEAILTKCEERAADLLAENEQLRDSFQAVYKDLQDLVRDDDRAAQSDPSDLAVFNAPLSMAEETVLSRVNSAMEMLKEKYVETQKELEVAKRKEKSGHKIDEGIYQDLVSKVKSLENDLEKNRHIIAEQSRLLDKAVAEDCSCLHVGHGVDRSFEVTTMEMQKEWEAFEARKSDLEKEREKFTEAAVKLGRERMSLERDRTLLQMERDALEYMQQEVLEQQKQQEKQQQQQRRQQQLMRQQQRQETTFCPATPSNPVEILYELDTLATPFSRHDQYSTASTANTTRTVSGRIPRQNGGITSSSNSARPDHRSHASPALKSSSSYSSLSQAAGPTLRHASSLSSLSQAASGSTLKPSASSSSSLSQAAGPALRQSSSLSSLSQTASSSTLKSSSSSSSLLQAQNNISFTPKAQQYQQHSRQSSTTSAATVTKSALKKPSSRSSSGGSSGGGGNFAPMSGMSSANATPASVRSSLSKTPSSAVSTGRVQKGVKIVEPLFPYSIRKPKENRNPMYDH